MIARTFIGFTPLYSDGMTTMSGEYSTCDAIWVAGGERRVGASEKVKEILLQSIVNSEEDIYRY